MKFDNILSLYNQSYMGNRKNLVKNLIGFIGIIILITNCMFYFKPSLIKIENIALGVMSIYIYKTYIYIKSIVSSNKATLFAVLPFSNSELFIAYFFRILIENFMKYIVLFIVPAYIYFIFNNLVNPIDLIKDFFQLLIISICSILIGFLIYILIDIKKSIYSIIAFLVGVTLIHKMFYKSVVFSVITLTVLAIVTVILFKQKFKVYGKNIKIYSENNVNLFKREIIRFRGDKILIVNHILTSIFCIIFLLNFNLNYNDVPMGMSCFLFCMLSITSTSSVLFSLEKDTRLIIQSLPLDPKILFLNKYLFLNLITIPNYIIIFSLLKFFGFNLGFWIMISILFASFYAIFTRLYIDYKNPCFTYDNTKQLLENKRKYFLFIVVIFDFSPLAFVEIIPIYLLILIETIGFVLSIMIIRKKL